MLETVDELRQRIGLGEIVSMIIAAEIVGRRRPSVALGGRFDTDPYRAMEALYHAHQAMQMRWHRARSGQLR